MNIPKRILQGHFTMLMLLVVGLFLPASAQSQKLESLTATAKGHGKVISATDELEITAALVILRENGTVQIAIYADVQLQAEGTWKASTSSPGEILLTITGGVLKGEMTGPGKLLLTSDRKSFKELSIAVKTRDGREITVTFVADASEPPKISTFFISTVQTPHRLYKRFIDPLHRFYAHQRKVQL